MPSQKQSIGDYGEQLARAYLEKQQYVILTTKWHCQYGELDIVAQKNNVIVFVEVKARRGQAVQQAFAAITPSKQKKLVASAHLFLDEYAHDILDWRIDVIGIAIPYNEPPIIEHVEDALGW